MLPAKAVLAIAAVLKTGADNGRDNWRSIPQIDHFNRALAHMFAWAAGDDQEPHLAHAACRLLMTLELSK